MTRDYDPKLCRACGAPRKAPTCCTNVLCGDCHARYCTPGGVTSPGHGVDIAQARADVARRRRE